MDTTYLFLSENIGVMMYIIVHLDWMNYFNDYAVAAVSIDVM